MHSIWIAITFNPFCLTSINYKLLTEFCYLITIKIHCIFRNMRKFVSYFSNSIALVVFNF